jgi:hypothetical protein
VLIALAACSAVPLLDSAQPAPPPHGTIVSDALKKFSGYAGYSNFRDFRSALDSHHNRMELAGLPALQRWRTPTILFVLLREQ